MMKVYLHPDNEQRYSIGKQIRLFSESSYNRTGTRGYRDIGHGTRGSRDIGHGYTFFYFQHRINGSTS